VSVVHQSVEDGVGQGGVGDRSVPLAERQLGGHHRGAPLVAVVHHLEEVARLGAGERRPAEVVEDQQIGLLEPREERPGAAVEARHSDLAEQACEAHVAHAQAQPAAGVSERAGQVGLAHAGGAEEEHVLVSSCEAALKEAPQGAAVEAPGAVEVDVFGAGGQAQARLPQEPRQGATAALGPLGVDEQAEALLEAQAAGRSALLLREEGVGHASQAHLAEAAEGRFAQHQRTSSAKYPGPRKCS
jgi:hypothetical protein